MNTEFKSGDTVWYHIVQGRKRKAIPATVRTIGAKRITIDVDLDEPSNPYGRRVLPDKLTRREP